MTATGKLHAKYDAVGVSDKFTKRDFVLMIADNPTYPQYVLFQLTQDKCNLLDLVEAGSDVAVDFNLRGRSWTSPQGETKYFNTLEAWRISPIASGSTVTAPQNVAIPNLPAAANVPAVNLGGGDDSGGDLPF
jgi:hypothetical protein